jgi:hypothetical protein
MGSSPLLIALMLSVAGCSVFGYEHHTAIGYVELYTSETDNSAQLRIPYKVSGRGNVHNPFSSAKWEFMSADWIRADKSQGISNLDGKYLTACPTGYNKWYAPSVVKGTIEILSTTIRIDLSVPKYDDKKITSWEPYEFNGEWTFVRPASSMLETTPSSTFNCEPGAA